MSDKPLYSRLLWAKENLKPVHSDYRVVFEADIDSPAAILCMDPNWLACALHGHILPPPNVYKELETDETGTVINGHILHENVVEPMTEEEAVQYQIQAFLPDEVANKNRPSYVIVKKDKLPDNRWYRDEWGFNHDPANPITVNFRKARKAMIKTMIKLFSEGDDVVSRLSKYVGYDPELAEVVKQWDEMDKDAYLTQVNKAKTLKDLDNARPMFVETSGLFDVIMERG